MQIKSADRFAESAQLADRIAERFHILPIALQSMLLCISNFIFDTNTTPYLCYVDTENRTYQPLDYHLYCSYAFQCIY